MAGKSKRIIYCWRINSEELTIYSASSTNGAVMVGMSLARSAVDCVSYFREYLPGMELERNRAMNESLIGAINAALANRPVQRSIPLDVESTDFQMSVWRAIARIPYGATMTYGEVAGMVGKPLAARAVGQAMGRNPLPIFFP